MPFYRSSLTLSYLEKNAGETPATCPLDGMGHAPGVSVGAFGEEVGAGLGIVFEEFGLGIDVQLASNAVADVAVVA